MLLVKTFFLKKSSNMEQLAGSIIGYCHQALTIAVKLKVCWVYRTPHISVKVESNFEFPVWIESKEHAQSRETANIRIVFMYFITKNLSSCF